MEFLVLIAANGGTGKALLAWLIHQASDHRNRSLAEGNRGAFSGAEMGRRLGGKVRGSFKGTLSRDETGKFQMGGAESLG
jgi:transcriptional regulator with PAS, ATPase and Fis domain